MEDEAPKSFADFQKLKYDNPVAYNDLCGHYSYKGRVPEATKVDYKTYKAIKATGIRGTIRVPPLAPQPAFVLSDKSAKDPDHIFSRMAERKVTQEDIQGYIDNALFSATQFKGDRRVFYTENGAVVLTKTKDYPSTTEWIVKTTWGRDDFDEAATRAIQGGIKQWKITKCTRSGSARYMAARLIAIFVMKLLCVCKVCSSYHPLKRRRKYECP